MPVPALMRSQSVNGTAKDAHESSKLDNLKMTKKDVCLKKQESFQVNLRKKVRKVKL
jgi:hypothetical protein